MSVPLLPADAGLHTSLIKKRLPGWVARSAPEDIRRLRPGLFLGHLPSDKPPAWLAAASPAMQQVLKDSQQRSRRSHETLAKTLKSLKSLTDFAEPLLIAALQKRFAQTPDVHKTMLYYLRYRQLPQVHSLLEAALLNFEGNEDFDQRAFGETSALAPDGALLLEAVGAVLSDGTRGSLYRYTDRLQITPAEFSSCCRDLDLGGQYQTHITQIFEAPDTQEQVRAQMIAAQKDLLAVRTHTARIKNEISESAYTMLKAVLAGTDRPSLDGKPVRYSQLSLFGCALGDVLLIGPGVGRPAPVPEVVTYFSPIGTLAKALIESAEDRFVVWIPGAPLYPLKEYPTMADFEKDLTVNLRSPAYQKLLTSLVPQEKAAGFLKHIKDGLHTYMWGPGYAREQVYAEQMEFNRRETRISGELFGALYANHLQRLKDNARQLGVPTAEADRLAAQKRREHWFSIGLNILNVAAFIVPGLGEVMMVVTAIQLGIEVYQGIEAWEEGDLDAAWDHLESVALNVAFMATLAAAGAKLGGKPPLIEASPRVDDLARVNLPNGETRLWKPDLTPYRSDAALEPGLKPDAQGQYEVAGKSYVRIGEGLYEKSFDRQINKWRIKHPSDPHAYQPILEHNRAGAWRHSHETPLQWDRPTLLRRLGHQAQGFSDETLRTIADISGVHDDALRKLHLDGTPVPSALEDTLRQFRADLDASAVIEQLRTGVGLDARCEYALPLVVQMPHWPEGRVLEVFDGPEPWGRSIQYGSPTSTADVRATIKLTRREVRQGKLPRLVLAELSESERTTMLGRQSSLEGASQQQVFQDRLADFALKRKPALVESLYRSSDIHVAGGEVLQRRFASLPGSAIRELLGSASARERTLLRTTGRVSARLDNLARVRAQQGRLNRALSGMQRQSLAVADSDALALHSLESLPGWRADLRLEVRAESVSGRLLDSVGPQDAPVRKYLVKDGDTFQAFDERGEALNSVVPNGRNFFESIMHALPDNARQGLDLPEVGQHAELQGALMRYASEHRSQMSGVLKQRAPRSRPSWQRLNGRVGYALSGRGTAASPSGSLTARLRMLYPDLTEAQAELLVQERRINGETDPQIFHRLANLQREFDGMRAELDQWISAPNGFETERREVADRVINCWRQNWRRGAPAQASLDLGWVADLPQLNADFSHVRLLRLAGEMMGGEQGATLLQRFPRVQHLDLFAESQQLVAIGERLGTMPGITELSIAGPDLTFTPETLEPITNLSQLRYLVLGGTMEALDVSRLHNLRTLSVSGSLAEWPTGVLSLEHLESLSLSGTQVRSMPPEMFTGHERLWRNLRLKWSFFEPQAFMAVYDHVQGNPAHLMDEEGLVRAYCDGRLSRLKEGDSAFAFNTQAEFKRLGLTGREQLLRVNALIEERRALEMALDEWQTEEMRVDRQRVDYADRHRVTQSLMQCWRAGLDARFATDGAMPGPSSAQAMANASLDLSGKALGNLPALPAGAFDHVRNLQLGATRLSEQSLNQVLGTFKHVRRLNLSGNRLAALPENFSKLTLLRYADLSRNELTITHAIQARLDSLVQLEQLNLSYNRVAELNVSKLTSLQSLDVSHTAISSWPKGVLELPALRELKLQRSAITRIDDKALTGHDMLMLATNLRGTPLSLQACQEVEAYAQRTFAGNTLGIPPEQLAVGRTGGDPEYFPLEAAEAPDLLIARPVRKALITPAARLQWLDPGLTDAQAVSRIEALSREGALALEAKFERWNEQHEKLIEQLNTWIDIRGYREGSGWVSAVDRRRAADKILESWRHNLQARPELAVNDGREILDFSGAYLGDLPKLPAMFGHVTELNLSGIKLTEQGSNDFLRAFTRVRSLTLSHNGLNQLPEVVREFTSLTRLEAAHNDLREAADVERCLMNMPALEWLDLSENTLETLDVSSLPQLAHLDLQANILVEWPTGVLQAPWLQRLNLSNNQIETIPFEIWEVHFDGLRRGTRLGDNLLDAADLERVREYYAETGNSMGITQQELDRDLDDDPWAEGEDEEDDHPEVVPPAEQKAQWFSGVPANSSRHAVWDRLKAAEDSDDFFYIISQLKNTQDFIKDKAELTGRVWEMLEAVDEYPELKEDLFTKARAMRVNATCGDGRILLFSDLEVSVYEFKALKNTPAGEEGATLFRLARAMIRLEEVESIANAAKVRNPMIDPAEIALAYRTDLAPRLQLPRQPKSMLYRNLSRVTQADINRAYTDIIARESTPRFVEQLVGRDYWVDYLKKQYPADYARLARQKLAAAEALEARYSDLTEQYLSEAAELDQKNRADDKALAIQLSVRERTRLGL